MKVTRARAIAAASSTATKCVAPQRYELPAEIFEPAVVDAQPADHDEDGQGRRAIALDDLGLLHLSNLTR